MYCPNCGTEINGNFCPNCGRNISEQERTGAERKETSGMVCPKCGSTNITMQIMQDKAKTKSRGRSRGLLWKLGRLLLILCTFGLWLLVGKSKGKGKSKTKFKNSTAAVCQNCGYSWKIAKVK